MDTRKNSLYTSHLVDLNVPRLLIAANMSDDMSPIPSPNGSLVCDVSCDASLVPFEKDVSSCNGASNRSSSRSCLDDFSAVRTS